MGMKPWEWAAGAKAMWQEKPTPLVKLKWGVGNEAGKRKRKAEEHLG